MRGSSVEAPPLGHVEIKHGGAEWHGMRVMVIRAVCTGIWWSSLRMLC